VQPLITTAERLHNGGAHVSNLIADLSKLVGLVTAPARLRGLLELVHLRAEATNLTEQATERFDLNGCFADRAGSR
jgi:hypothetical protein